MNIIVRLTAAAIMAVTVVGAASSISVHKALAISDPDERSAKNFAPGRVAIGDPDERVSDIAPGHYGDPNENNPGHLKNLPR